MPVGGRVPGMPLDASGQLSTLLGFWGFGSHAWLLSSLASYFGIKLQQWHSLLPALFLSLPLLRGGDLAGVRALSGVGGGLKTLGECGAPCGGQGRRWAKKWECTSREERAGAVGEINLSSQRACVTDSCPITVR